MLLSSLQHHSLTLPLHLQGLHVYTIYICVSILFFFFLSIYLFLAALGLHCCTRASSSCGAQASHCGGFSCCGARALGAWASVVATRGLSSCGSRAPERRLSSRGIRAQLLRGMWDLPGPGIEPVSPALAGGFPTTAPPGKPHVSVFLLLDC